MNGIYYTMPLEIPDTCIVHDCLTPQHCPNTMSHLFIMGEHIEQVALWTSRKTVVLPAVPHPPAQLHQETIGSPKSSRAL